MKLILLCTVVALLIIPTVQVIALEEYTVLAPLPGTTKGGCTTGDCKTDLPVYLGGVYRLIIGLSFTLAFAMIVFGGIQYLSTDAVSGKSDGRKRIEDALWGLIIILSAYLLLETIDKSLLQLTFLQG